MGGPARRVAALASLICILGFAGFLLGSSTHNAAASRTAKAGQSSEPWTPGQVVAPAAFAKELADSPASRRPAVVCVGFRTLYEGAHIPGASFHGPAWNAEGLADLKKWAEPLPRSSNIVVYCGCCPLSHCPNLRPGFAALRDMGFTHLRVLLMPNNLAADWIRPGYPIAKGK
jgi:hypothetical protein